MQIVLGSLLGKGMFGQTYLGCWRGGDLAVKCVRVSKESEAASFLREVAALAAIRHPNVMQFYGESLCFRTGTCVALVYHVLCIACSKRLSRSCLTRAVNI